jgi:hypothetical protein
MTKIINANEIIAGSPTVATYQNGGEIMRIIQRTSICPEVKSTICLDLERATRKAVIEINTSGRVKPIRWTMNLWGTMINGIAQYDG